MHVVICCQNKARKLAYKYTENKTWSTDQYSPTKNVYNKGWKLWRAVEGEARRESSQEKSGDKKGMGGDQNTHTQHARTHTHAHSLSLCHTHTHTHTCTHACTHKHTHTHSLTSLPLPLSLSHTHTHIQYLRQSGHSWKCEDRVRLNGWEKVNFEL